MEKKIRKHRIFDRHTGLGLFLMMIGGLFLSQVVLGGLLSLAVMRTGPDFRTSLTMTAGFGGLLLLAFHYFWFTPEYDWRYKKENIPAGFKLLLPILGYWAILFGMFGFFAGRIPFGPITLTQLCSAAGAGMTEEVVYRELPISYMARQWRDEKKIPLMVLIPGLVFGLVHLGNGLFTGNAADYLLQAVLCVFFGIFFSAVYLRTGKVLPVIVMHGLHDILVLSAASYTPELPDSVAVVWLVCEGALALYGLFLIRKEKRVQIMALWDRKWNRQESGR